MEKELQRKIAWAESRHRELARTVDKLEAIYNNSLDENVMKELKIAKKEKLRMKDMSAMLKRLK